MQRVSVRTWVWVSFLVGGCFGEAPRVGDSGGSTGAGSSDGDDPIMLTSGMTPTEGTGGDAEGDATATGGEGTTAVATEAVGSEDASDGGSAETDSTDSGGVVIPPECVHRVFVTSEVSKADLGGLQGADDMCKVAGGALGSRGGWVSVLSSSGTAAKDRVDITGPVCRIDGVIVAHDENEWWSDMHLAPINVTEHGSMLGASATSKVWTGSQFDGQPNGAHCEGWTSESANVGGALRGDAQASNAHWIFDGNIGVACSSSGRLYCIEQF